MPVTNIEKLYQNIGSLIKDERNKRGISQEVLATHLNLTRASIINLEKGRHRPSIHQLIEIAEILNIHFVDLIPKNEIPIQKSQKSLLNDLSNIITDQSIMNKSTKTVLVNFLSSINKH